MLQRFKQYLLIAVVLGAFYFLLSNHILFSDLKSFNIIRKSELTLKYTFLNLKRTHPETMLRIEELRNGGVGDLLVEKGILSAQQLDQTLKKIDLGH